MSKDELKKLIYSHTAHVHDFEVIWTAVEAYIEASNGAKLPVVSSYLRGLGRIHDFEFSDLAEKHGRSEDELIEDLVNEGWTIGKDDSGHNVWWE